MIQFKSKLNDDALQSLNKNQLKKMMGPIAIISVCMLVIGIYLYYMVNMFIGMFLILFGIIYLPMLLIINKCAIKKNKKTMPILSDETITTYEFNEDEISVSACKENMFHSQATYKYSCIYKAVETKESYLLYISNHQAEVILKKDIIEGSIEELNHILKMNLKDRVRLLKK